MALVAAALLLATLSAYHPAWHGGLLWDDVTHVTSAELRSLHGLWRIWGELGATQQYYPLTHSAFWFQHRLWGDGTFGYHLVNIFLHTLSALLLMAILRRLRVPGAVLAGVVFALHPVHVESVAWIAELKNVLSGALYLGAALAYLQFDRERTRRAYAMTAALFCLALLSKSVTATLPGALLVVLWWQRGRLDWRRDGTPLIPFFVAGAAAGLFTAWVERAYIGAEGTDFQLMVFERGLLAGRVIWFYLGKLFWPADLVFIYPRWEIDQAGLWQYGYPAGVLLLVAAAWAWRARSRAPLAALLAFIGTLFPALGFVDVYPFRFSYVADHFQYLASVPIIALASAGIATLGQKWAARPGLFVGGAALASAAILGTLTWQQSRQYADELTLYRTTLQRNPSAWLAHSNLGVLLRKSNPEEALTHARATVRLKPDLGYAYYNLGNVLQELGRYNEAVDQYREAVRLTPGMALAHYHLGHSLQQLDRLEEAKASFDEAVRIDPGLALAHSALGRVLQRLNRPVEALQACRTAVRLQPDLAVARYDLGTVLQQQGRLEDAVEEFKAALRIEPEVAEAQNDLAYALQQLGRFDEAIKEYERAAALAPESALVRVGLGTTLRTVGRMDEARKACESAVLLQPDVALAHYEFANVLQQQGQLDAAVEQYRTALAIEAGVPEIHYGLAAALERQGRAGEARAEEALADRLAADPVTAHASRGSALEAIGHLDRAREEFTQALRLAPDFDAARRALARIEVQRRLPAGAGIGRPAAERD